MKEPKMRWWWCLFFVACGPRLSREMIENHPRIKIEKFEPQVVEASAPVQPRWIESPERGAVAYVPFVGQASGPTLDAAKAQCMRDLIAQVSNFVAVDVTSEFEAFESSKNINGKEDSSFFAREVTRTRTAASIEGIKPDALFWEKVQASPLLADSTSYRVYAYAKVPKVEITRARLKKQLARQSKSGKKMVVVLPFRKALAADPAQAALAAAFAEELSRLLMAQGQVQVSDPGLVRSLLEGDKGATEIGAMEAVREALSPDYIVGGTYQMNEGKLRVSFTVYGTEDALAGGSAERPLTELFALEDALLSEIQKSFELTSEKVAPPKAEVAPRSPVDASARQTALTAYQEAFEAYRGGRNQVALERLSAALTADPSFGRAHLRIGRVLEREGWYGKRLPLTFAPQRRDLAFCVDPARIDPDLANGDWRGWLARQDQALERRAPPARGAVIEYVLSATIFVLNGGFIPDPGVPVPSEAAVDAYWQSFKLAQESGDALLARESLFALADLGARNDRPQEARAIYTWLLGQAKARNDLHEQSLALFGLGKVAREEGQPQQAFSLLQQALEIRQLTLEKPYLLEILNELGQVALELGATDSARGFYTKAERLADELGDTYLVAVLGNNLGVLEFGAGRARHAEALFERAWQVLRDLNEAEGQLSSGLNLGWASAARGDVEAAQRYLAETRRIVDTTRQEGRLARQDEHEGTQALGRGEPWVALQGLVRGWGRNERLGRFKDLARLEVALRTAELRAVVGSPEQTTATECVRQQLHQLMNDFYAGDPSGLSRRYSYYRYDHQGRLWSPHRGVLQQNPIAVISGGNAYLSTWLTAEVLEVLQ